MNTTKLACFTVVIYLFIYLFIYFIIFCNCFKNATSLDIIGA